MAELLYIKDTKEKNLLLLGISESGETARYTVNRALYSDIGMPCVGCKLDDGAMEEIKAFDEYYRVKKKALSLLSIADNNCRTLRLKLLRAGFSKQACDECVNEMVALGYINEERTLERLILAEVRSLRGPSRITAHLVSKGYSSAAVKRVMDKLICNGDIDFLQTRRKLIETRLPKDASEEEIKKILYKQGF